MKKGKMLLISFAVITMMTIACHDKANDQTNTNTTDTTATQVQTTAPVQISSDDSLQKGVRDATKDYPGITGTVNNGEITLTGDITRDRLTGLMQSINSLHPKKINNNLTLK